MATQNRNEAYDFALFEPKRREAEAPKKQDNVIKLPDKDLEKNRRPKHQNFKFISRCALLLVMLGVVGTIVLGQVKLTEMTEGINQASKKLEEQKSVYTQLQMKSEGQLSRQGVEDYAKDELGMRRVEQDQVTYVGVSEGDRGQVLKDTGAGNWLSALWERIQQLLS